jgi:hypothetical protein
MAGPTAEEMLQFIQGSSGNVPATPSITMPQEDSGMPSSEDMLKFIQKTSPTVKIKQETDILPEDDEKYVEYYTKRMLPVPDNAVPFYDYSKDIVPQQSEVEKVKPR